MIGRRMKRYSGGVPVVPYQRFIHDWPNLEPSRQSRITFRYWTILSSTVAGFIFAGYVTEQRTVLNHWYNRPDLKPFPAMVA
jgi:hypothetical protein